MRGLAACGGLLLALGVAQARAEEPCVVTAADKAADAQLPFDEFDQQGASPTSWRTLSLRGCPEAASEAMEAYLIDGPVTDPQQRANMAFHLGQTLAMAGHDDEAAIAVASAKYGAGPDATGFDWNTYVVGTWAFLVRDRARLEAARDKLAAEPGDGNRLNAAALAGLARCFDRPYTEAYATACRSPQ